MQGWDLKPYPVMDSCLIILLYNLHSTFACIISLASYNKHLGYTGGL